MTAKGGTVDVLSTVDWTSLDPANNYLIDSSEVGRLIYRTLTFVKDTPGEDLSVQPDLAESLGTSSDGGKTWTYKLREGLKYEDGKPITAADVKYGIQRSFAQDVYDEGATYMVDLLENKTEYAGPYTTPEKDLTSVETPDDRTLVFHFTGPQADADWILSQAYHRAGSQGCRYQGGLRRSPSFLRAVQNRDIHARRVAGACPQRPVGSRYRPQPTGISRQVPVLCRHRR